MLNSFGDLVALGNILTDDDIPVELGGTWTDPDPEAEKEASRD